MTDKPCPRCINGPMPTWGNVDQVWYCDRHVGEIIRGIKPDQRQTIPPHITRGRG